MTLGSETQKQRYLRPLFTCEEIWCQLFSEPGAGSDVASLATRADPRRRRVDRQWPEGLDDPGPHLAFGMVLARTDPEAEKHRGITYFVVDMHAPGVEVRPLRQMTGEAEFNEVYFTDVRIPDAERLGDVGDGWRGALDTLMNERVSIGGTVSPRGQRAHRHGRQPVDSGLRAPEGCRHPGPADAAVGGGRGAPADQHARAAANARAGTPGPEGSIAKLAYAELNKRIYEFCVDLLGPEGMLYDSYEMRRPENAGRRRISAAHVPPGPSQLDRGRHLRGHAQHPGRAGARPARRRPCGQGPSLVPGAAQLVRLHGLDGGDPSPGPGPARAGRGDAEVVGRHADVLGESVEEYPEDDDVVVAETPPQTLIEGRGRPAQAQKGVFAGRGQFDQLDSPVRRMTLPGDQALTVHAVQMMRQRGFPNPHGLGELPLVGELLRLEIHQHQPHRQRSTGLLQSVVEGAADRPRRASQLKADGRARPVHCITIPVRPNSLIANS